MRRLRSSAAAVAFLLFACHRPPAPAPAYVEEIEKFRARRVASLTKEDGWLAVVGLHWLKPGENPFGSDESLAVVLKAPDVPSRAGAFDLRPDGTVGLKVEAGAPVQVNGAPPSGAPLTTDRTGKPDVVTVGHLRLTVLQRGDQVAIRTRDPEAPARKAFQGISYFPIDPRLRVEGTLEPYPSPREVEVPSAQGPAQKMLAPGLVRFAVGPDSKAEALEPYVEGPEDTTYFFVFRDQTAGTETYGAGRFLYADVPKEGKKVILDFNRATNPPCAFTAFATCPLPTQRNDLPVRIEAGEKAPAGH